MESKSQVVFTIEKAPDALYFTRDGETVRVSYATPEESGYMPWMLTNKGEEPEQIGWMRSDNNFVYYFDNDLNLIKRKVK